MASMQEILSYAQLQTALNAHKKFYLLLYKSGSESSECAFRNVREAADGGDTTVFYADVNKVRDIHTQYGINTVPNLLVFENGTLKNSIRGCNENAHYRNMFTQLFKAGGDKETSAAKHVTVYSTPSCPWCSTLKNYLRQHQIAFRDIDVSRDMQAAEEMVRRSGQRGVPQTDINGQMVVGFDKARINYLLEIKG
ncbi:MAG: glutaredoxin domain-containing protein [Candidatus Neomarinimicrobiota bacterium]|jgi:glutaredoxin-like YruB-family protein|nr:glutaredoxin domain-containing protein [Candidatus Neomarinimicrobiota bacterium]MDD3965480.1 glutaredoxin domain-containing protein [Candidatus Neomarinimicrobiota bacterium]MDX9780619.1 glutaredoxin domain-containing protein [bacterium]